MTAENMASCGGLRAPYCFLIKLHFVITASLI